MKKGSTGDVRRRLGEAERQAVVVDGQHPLVPR